MHNYDWVAGSPNSTIKLFLLLSMSVAGASNKSDDIRASEQQKTLKRRPHTTEIHTLTHTCRHTTYHGVANVVACDRQRDNGARNGGRGRAREFSGAGQRDTHVSGVSVCACACECLFVYRIHVIKLFIELN